MDGLPRTLTPLAALLDRIAALSPLMRTETAPLAQAVGRVLAEALRAEGPLPARPVARRSGVAVRAEETLGAGPYAPALLTLAEPVPAGGVLPAGADAVLAHETVEQIGTGFAATVPAAPGDGAVGAGGEAAPGALLVPSGTLLGPTHIAVAAALGRERLMVRAEPRVAIELDGPARQFLRAVVGDAPGPPDVIVRPASGEPCLAARPIETVELAEAEGVPILHLPGGAAAWLGWCALGAPILRRLSGRPEPEPVTARLSGRIASAVGMTDLVLVRLRGETAEPLASPDAPTLTALAAADGIVVIPPESEGLPAGAPVAVQWF
jgi:molybdopterin molybdotransferase